MTRDLTWLDLCCGLKGASQPAIDRGWKVITVDIDPRFKPDIVADVRALPFRPFRVDVLWASPPCTEFTKWGLPASWACNGKSYWKGGRPEPSTDLVQACLTVIDLMRPAWWILENVMASRKFITPLAGAVRAMVTGHVFWGRLPTLLPQTVSHKWRLPPTEDRQALRAKIPYEIGDCICRAVENRTGK